MPIQYVPLTSPAPASAPDLPVAERVGEGSLHGRLLRYDCRAACAWMAEHGLRADLVYIDPPFNSGVDYKEKVWVRPVAGGSPHSLERTLYTDVWDRDAYLDWMYGNLLAIRSVMASGASLYVHLDAHISHYVKVLLDQVFGEENFQREIVWRIGWVSGFKSAGENWIRNHDTIFYYTVGPRRTFHKSYLPYPEGYTRRDGKPPAGKGIPLEDTWNFTEEDRLDSIQIKSFSTEKTGYATQKPQALLERIISASSDPGDLVCDFFGGSGVTAAAAHKLGRQFLHGDVGARSVQIARDRLREAGAAFEVRSLPAGSSAAVDFTCSGAAVTLTGYRSVAAEEHLAPKGKRPPTPRGSGVELIERVSVDCTASEGPWHADGELATDKHGRIRGTDTAWDCTISAPRPPLRLKVRDIFGTETVCPVDREEGGPWKS